MLSVPALLMVSTIRFQSFKSFDLGMQGGYRILLLVAAFIGLLVTYPHEVLIVIAYAYFASGFVGTLMSKLKGKSAEPIPAEAPASKQSREVS